MCIYCISCLGECITPASEQTVIARNAAKHSSKILSCLCSVKCHYEHNYLSSVIHACDFAMSGSATPALLNHGFDTQLALFKPG